MKFFTSIGCLAVLVAVLLWPAASAWTDIEHRPIFSFTGDGVVGMHDVQTDEIFNVIYRDTNGHYDEQALSTIDHVFRCHGDQKTFPISVRLVELLDFIQDHFKAGELKIISGYRSPDYNDGLRRRSRRVSRESLHMEGLAADVVIPGVSALELAKYAKSLDAGGVGFYGNRAFVHIDVGPVRHW
jgi:uncharacterized protein YcbK (DUF882 family)